MKTVVNFVCDRLPDQDGCRFIELENDRGESVGAEVGEWHRRDDGLVELRVELSQPPIIQTLHDNADLIALQATVAQQAKMIEHLRGGLGNEPQLVSCAEDMSTCTLTNGDGIGYCYNRVDPDLPPPLYTAVDMANAARDERNGIAESLVERLAIAYPDSETTMTVECFADWLSEEMKP